MKLSVLLLAGIGLFGGCHATPPTTASVLMQPAKDKQSLIKMGFAHPSLDSLLPSFPAVAGENSGESRRKWSDNLLSKRIKDTDVLYTFQAEELVSVQILISHIDPTRLYHLLDTLGFERVGPGDGRRQVFENKQANIRYEMDLAAGQAIFTDRNLSK